MPYGTLDRSPPPFFRQGPSALSKLVFFSALALFLMVGDTRLRWTEPIRAALAVALLPVQRAIAVPLEMWHGGEDYLRGLREAQASEAALRRENAALAERSARTAQLQRENDELRRLLDLRAATAVRSTPAEVLYEAADPYSRKVFVAAGSQAGIVLGAPVIDARGVLGQVTRLYPLSAEVTLLVDKDAAIPVLNARTLQRGAAFGAGGRLELRFTSANADVKAGDPLLTSGLDGIYPPGLAVGRVAEVERRADTGFARITIEPAAPAGGVRHVLVLEPLSVQLPPRPEPPPAEAVRAKPDHVLKTPPRRAGAASAGGAP